MASHELFFDTYTLTGYGLVIQMVEGRNDRRIRDFELDDKNISRIMVGPEKKGLLFKTRVDRILLVTKKNVRVELWKPKTKGLYDTYVGKLRDFAKRNAVPFAETQDVLVEER
ncbi:MAG: hypothetical protein J0L75_06235 [Spirochaetes bacterium]|nr:hypothetical protein [Spirochaetota bacterium]